MRILRWNDQEATPWKNGGGTTRNIAAAPDGATLADFDWRISIADVEADGPFSAFDGVDRVIMLIEGAQMQLEVAGRPHRLERLEAFAFHGEDPTSCRVPSGPTRDVNLMTRRGRATGEMRAVQVEHEHAAKVAAGDVVVLFALTAGLTIDSGLELSARDAVICEAAEVVHVRGSGTLVEIRVGIRQ